MGSNVDPGPTPVLDVSPLNPTFECATERSYTTGPSSTGGSRESCFTLVICDMSDLVRILRVVVASPGDVKKERDLVPLVLEELNKSLGADRRIRLEAVRWETDAYPGFDRGGPQGLIDPILGIEHCDILVGIFWKRLGTSTPDGTTGAEHEFKTAYDAWQNHGRPQVMVYFNRQPHSPQSSEETDQWRKVLAFREAFPKEGLWWSYRGPSEFAKLLRLHLTNFLRAKFPLTAAVLESPVSTVVMPHELQAPPGDFTGQSKLLADLVTSKNRAGFIISGMAGVGKTVLALKLAESLKPRYPDSQLFINLLGKSQKPLSPLQAIKDIIESYPGTDLPSDDRMLAGKYISVLHDQRSILFLDDARDEAQVQPLLPPADSLVIVTSRKYFVLPEFETIRLEKMSADDAETLLLKIEPRIGSDAAALARVCGYLPQVLRLAGSAIAVHVDMTPSAYIRRLSDSDKRLEMIESSLNLSYGLLNPAQQRLWRALGVFGDAFDATAAAAVWEIDHDDAQDVLSDTLAHSMVEWNEQTRRYRLHDLAKAFADKNLGAQERLTALSRHAAYYARVATMAYEIMVSRKSNSVNRGFALLSSDWTNITTGQSWAATRVDKDEKAARLCVEYATGAAYFRLAKHDPPELVRWLEVAARAGQRLGDQKEAMVNLGLLAGAYELAAAAYAEERDHQDSRRIRATRENLRQAVRCREEEATIAREFCDSERESDALQRLVDLYMWLGEMSKAAESGERAVLIHRKLGNRIQEAAALAKVGDVHYNLNDQAHALENYESAASIYHDLKDIPNEAKVLTKMGQAYGKR
jgi:tetratricopeptide (TPR) repeat protein